MCKVVALLTDTQIVFLKVLIAVTLLDLKLPNFLAKQERVMSFDVET